MYICKTKQTLYVENINATLKENDALLAISSSVKLSISEVIEKVLRELGKFIDVEDPEYFGKDLTSISETEELINMNTIFRKCFEVNPENYEAKEIFGSLILFGTEQNNPCPDCGCETVEDPQGMNGHEWIDFECSNCEWAESGEPDWDCMPGGKDYY